MVYYLPFAALMCMSCVASVGPHGTSIAIAPPLPAYVELYEPYYAIETITIIIMTVDGITHSPEAALG